MVGQQAYEWYASSGDVYLTDPLTVQVKNSKTGTGRNTFAEVALGHVAGEDAQIMITQIVSDSGVENLGGERLAVYRKNVTSVTVQLMVVDSLATGRLFLNYWS